MHWKMVGGSITEQMIAGRADVTLGGGAKSFSQVAKAGEWKDKSLRDQALARGYVIVENLDDLNAIKQADQQKPLLGLFSLGNMPVRWQGPKASYHGNLDKPPVVCENNAERTKDVPTLAVL